MRGAPLQSNGGELGSVVWQLDLAEGRPGLQLPQRVESAALRVAESCVLRLDSIDPPGGPANSAEILVYRLVWPRPWGNFADVSCQSLGRTRRTVGDESYYYSPRIMCVDVIGRFFSVTAKRFWAFPRYSHESLISEIVRSQMNKKRMYFRSGLLNPTNTGRDPVCFFETDCTRVLKRRA